MTERDRKTAFVLTVIVIAAVWVGLQFLEGDSSVIEDSAEPETTVSSAGGAEAPGSDPIVLGEDGAQADGERGEGAADAGGHGSRQPEQGGDSRASSSGPEEPVDPATAEDAPAGSSALPNAAHLVEGAEDRAREFMDAFLTYEVSGPTEGIRQTIAPLVSPSLAEAIAADELQRPVGAGNAGKGTLLTVLGEPTGEREVAVIATVAYAGDPSGILLALRKSPSGWLVEDVG